MKLEMGFNECEPMIEVVGDGDDMVVRFWGFGVDEAKEWFNSAQVMDSLGTWHELLGDFEMPVRRKPIRL